MLLVVAVLVAAFAAGRSTAQADAAGIAFFERSVRPLLVEHCYKCHSTEKRDPKTDLLLDSRDGWRRGGAGGQVVVPGDPDQSRLVRAVRYTDPELQMPPKGRLGEQQVRDLEEWVRRGAPDPREGGAAATTSSIDWEAARRHWAFQPVRRVTPPAVRDASWCRNEVDRFVLARLEAAGLRPAPEADRRTLLRRVTFDLIGLPPAPDEVAAFVADDSSDAFERAVDRLLASPHYGERQARHWLDLARYSDSNGLDENLALGSAWRWRDWVVQSFNADKPYDRFLVEQIAGDLLPQAPSKEATFDQWTGTGFLVLGPKMLAEQDKDKLLLDVVDEQLDVLGQSMLGLTLGCARCHDHKFDPLPTRDYYALAGVFKSTSTMRHLDHVSLWRERELATAEELARREAWQKERTEADRRLAGSRQRADRELDAAAVADLARYLVAGSRALAEGRLIEAEAFARGNLITDRGQWGSPVTAIARSGKPGLQFAEYEVQIVAAGRYRLEVRYAAKESRPMRVLAGGAPVVEAALAATTGDWFPAHQEWQVAGELDLAAGRHVLRLERDQAVPHLDKLLLVPAADADWPRGRDWCAGLEPRLVRAVAARLSSGGDADPVLGPWQAFAALPDEGFAAGAAALASRLRAEAAAGARQLSPLVAALLAAPPPASRLELAARYQTLFAVVAHAWQALVEAPSDKPAARLADAAQEAVRLTLLGADGLLVLSAGEREALHPAEARAAIAALRRELAALDERKPPAYPSILAVAEAEPVDLPVHVRGSHLTLGPEPIARGAPAIFDGCLPAPAMPKQASGRLELARWLVDARHPLTARVAVNRLWSHCFGQGLVRSPSNFGRRGDVPSHPELLDWLASELVGRGWSLKAMHRLLVLSATYRLSASHDAAAAAADPENRLLWRQNRRRLEAEAIRDAMLAASGQLDRRLGGTLLATPNLEYVTNDQSNDRARYDSPRRSLYLPVIRNALYDLYSAFDYNDPSVSIEQRPATVTPLQALWLRNSPFAAAQSAALAQRVEREAGTEPAARLARAHQLALGRPPAAAELDRLLAFLAGGGTLASACRVLFCCSEFVYLD